MSKRQFGHDASPGLSGPAGRDATCRSSTTHRGIGPHDFGDADHRYATEQSPRTPNWDRVILAGHSFGTNLACYFLLAHPERVDGLILLAGPFLDPWREADKATQRERRSDRQQTRLEELDAVESRTDTEEIEFLALSSFTDHADRGRAWDWAMKAAHTRRPLNYVMNRQVNAAKNADPLDFHVDELRNCIAARRSDHRC